LRGDPTLFIFFIIKALEQISDFCCHLEITCSPNDWPMANGILFKFMLLSLLMVGGFHIT